MDGLLAFVVEHNVRALASSFSPERFPDSAFPFSSYKLFVGGFFMVPSFLPLYAVAFFFFSLRRNPFWKWLFQNQGLSPLRAFSP